MSILQDISKDHYEGWWNISSIKGRKSCWKRVNKGVSGTFWKPQKSRKFLAELKKKDKQRVRGGWKKSSEG